MISTSADQPPLSNFCRQARSIFAERCAAASRGRWGITLGICLLAFPLARPVRADLPGPKPASPGHLKPPKPAASTTEKPSAEPPSTEPSAEGARDYASVRPGDVEAAVMQLRGDLEKIRYEMGRPTSDLPDIPVTNVTPREVYFQAQTLLVKVDQLCFEKARASFKMPQFKTSDFNSGDVLRLVQLAEENLQIVKKELHIPESTPKPPINPNTTPEQVFASIVQANRQLNILTEQSFKSEDLFEQATKAIGYTSRLLDRFPGADAIPSDPPFERGKTLQDIENRIINCFDMIEEIARISGVQVADLDTTLVRKEKMDANELYDLNSLMLSELAHLYSMIPDTTRFHSYYPSPKLPSHVYQRLGILEAQLNELIKLSKADPDWLKRAEQEKLNGTQPRQ